MLSGTGPSEISGLGEREAGTRGCAYDEGWDCGVFSLCVTDRQEDSGCHLGCGAMALDAEAGHAASRPDRVSQEPQDLSKRFTCKGLPPGCCEIKQNESEKYQSLLRTMPTDVAAGDHRCSEETRVPSDGALGTGAVKGSQREESAESKGCSLLSQGRERAGCGQGTSPEGPGLCVLIR